MNARNKLLDRALLKILRKLPFKIQYKIQHLKIFSWLYFYLVKIPGSKIPYSINNGGVILTFDDCYVDEWYQTDSLLSKYNWKASFCVSNHKSLNDSQVHRLLELQNRGHEIAGHGFNHFNQIDFLLNNTVNDYLNKEILPMLNFMRNNSFIINSFAYPQGARNEKLDFELLKEFKILRGTTYDVYKPSDHNCFFNNNRVCFAIGIDSHYKHFTEKYLLNLLEFAKNTKQIVLLYGHRPVNKITDQYQTSIKTLEVIAKFINKNHMNFYTLNDLHDYIK